MRHLLAVVLGLSCSAYAMAQNGEQSFNELEFGDDNFSLDGDEGSAIPEAEEVGPEILPDFATDTVDNGIDFGNDPAAQEPKVLKIDEQPEVAPPQVITKIETPTGKVERMPAVTLEDEITPVSNIPQTDSLEPATQDAFGQLPTDFGDVGEGFGGALPDNSVVEDEGPIVPIVVPMNQFSGTPYVPGSRRNMAPGEAPERYRVAEGDTLYDVCDQLLDESDYWPKLWALNPGIKNPHFIFPGMVLSFYPGDETTPPYLEVVSEDDVVPLDTGGVDEGDLISAEIGDLEVVQDAVPAVEVIEAARTTDFGDQLNEEEFEVFGDVFVPSTVQVDIPAFFFPKEADVLGRVVGGHMGEINAKVDDRIVVEKFSDLPVGTSFTIVRPSGAAINGRGEPMGFRYEFVAQLQVAGGTEDGDFIIANITRSRLGVRPEDQVISYMSTQRQFRADRLVFSESGKDASIIGFGDPGRVFAVEGNMVFVDDAALPSGATLPVYQRIDKRIEAFIGKELPDIRSRIGIIRIIDTVGEASLGVVIKSTLDIRVGDSTGRG